MLSRIFLQLILEKHSTVFVKEKSEQKGSKKVSTYSTENCCERGCERSPNAHVQARQKFKPICKGSGAPPHTL